MSADMFTKLRDIQGEGNDARDGTDTDGHCYLIYQLSRADGPDTLTSDVTDQSVEVVGQPTETIWMTYGEVTY